MVLQGLECFDSAILKQRLISHSQETSGIDIINKSRVYYKKLVDPFYTLDEWMNSVK